MFLSFIIGIKTLLGPPKLSAGIMDVKYSQPLTYDKNSKSKLYLFLQRVA